MSLSTLVGLWGPYGPGGNPIWPLLLVVCANETTKVWFQPSGRALQQFFQKGCPQLGRKFPQPGRNFKKWRIVILLTVNILCWYWWSKKGVAGCRFVVCERVLCVHGMGASMWQGNGLEDHIRWNEATSDFPVVRFFKAWTLFLMMCSFFLSLFSATTEGSGIYIYV